MATGNRCFPEMYAKWKEASHERTNKILYDSTHETLRAVKFTETERRVVAKGWEEGRMGIFNGYSFSFARQKEVLEMDVIMVAQQCECI